MNHPGQTNLREEDLHAYVDGRLDAAARQAVETWLASHPQDAARVQAYRQQNQLLHSLFDPALAEPLPPALQAASRRRRRYVPAAMAAALAWMTLGGSGGWLLHAYYQTGETGLSIATLPQRAAIAHVVYTPEVLHPVEVDAQQETHLAAWLSKRLGTTLRIPHLQTVGYDLVGGRLLPDRDRPAAQFMYQDASGRRLTLYARLQNGTAREPTAFRYSLENKVAVFYWVDGDVGYALSGEIDKAQLLQAAEIAYRELNL